MEHRGPGFESWFRPLLAALAFEELFRFSGPQLSPLLGRSSNISPPSYCKGQVKLELRVFFCKLQPDRKAVSCLEFNPVSQGGSPGMEIVLQ